jgi:hypothetical protein
VEAVRYALGGRSSRFRGAVAAAAAALALLAFGPSAAAAAGIGSLRICTSCAASGGDLSRYDYVILHAWEHGRIAALKAANPNLKAIVYKDMSFTVSYAAHDGVDNELLPAGVGYHDADTNHPEWFLLDTQGRRVESAYFPGLWLMDVGNAAYQQAWLENVARELRARGWDGVMLDDTNYSADWHLAGRKLARYTDAGYRAATRSFLARVGPPLMGEEFLVLPNVYTAWPSGHDVWRDWLQFTSGAVQEYWTKWGDDRSMHFTGADWSYRREFLRITQEAGKIYLGITYAPADDVRSMRYARANFLLDWDGGPSALVFEPSPGGRDPYSREWTIDLGTPLGPAYRVDGVWRRNFTEGIVLVNPSTAAATIELGGTFYLPDGSEVTSATLGSARGLVLRSATGPDTTAPQTILATAPIRATSADNASFRFAARERGARFRCRLDRGPVRRCSASKLFTAVGPGRHTLSVAAVDRAGNVDASPAVHSWKVRRLRPRIRLGARARTHSRVVRLVGKVRLPATLSQRVRHAAQERRRTVTLYRKARGGDWRRVARLRTGTRGGFDRRVRIRYARTTRLLAVGRYGDVTVTSRVTRVRLPRR